MHPFRRPIAWLQAHPFVAISGIAGVVAAVLPARRAAKLDVLEAISAV